MCSDRDFGFSGHVAIALCASERPAAPSSMSEETTEPAVARWAAGAPRGTTNKARGEVGLTVLSRDELNQVCAVTPGGPINEGKEE